MKLISKPKTLLALLVLVVCVFSLLYFMGDKRTYYLDSPKKDVNKTSEFVVPNKVHYVWYADKNVNFTFQQYLSVLSVHRFQKPDGIFFHTNMPPSGEYWNETLKIPKFYVVNRKRPKEIFGVQMKKPVFETSDSDISRVKILMEEGGIYLDTDVWVIRSLDPLRKYDCVMGEEMSNSLAIGGSIVLANKGSVFLKLWMEHFLFDYRVESWAYNSVIVPTKLYQQYPNILHVEKEKLQHPAWNKLEYLYGKMSYPWRENYTLHLWRSMEKRAKTNYEFNISPDSIKSLKSTFGQAARYIYM